MKPTSSIIIPPAVIEWIKNLLMKELDLRRVAETYAELWLFDYELSTSIPETNENSTEHEVPAKRSKSDFQDEIVFPSPPFTPSATKLMEETLPLEKCSTVDGFCEYVGVDHISPDSIFSDLVDFMNSNGEDLESMDNVKSPETTVEPTETMEVIETNATENSLTDTQLMKARSIVIPRIIVTPMDKLFRLVTAEIRKKFRQMMETGTPLSKKELSEKLAEVFEYTKNTNKTMEADWKHRLEQTRRNGGTTRRRTTLLWQLLEQRRSNQVPHRNPNGNDLGPERSGSANFSAGLQFEKDFVRLLEKQEEQVRHRRQKIKERKAVDNVRKDIMYLEQMLPHLSIDRELVEEEAKTKTRFAEVPESFMGLKDGAYWISSQKLHNMVTTAIRYRNEKDGKGNETIYFLLKDWNELRIRYEGPCRLPKDVLVTLSPYQAIAPVVNKKPYGRFRTEMTGVIDLS